MEQFQAKRLSIICFEILAILKRFPNIRDVTYNWRKKIQYTFIILSFLESRIPHDQEK